MTQRGEQGILPGDVADKLLVIHDNTQLAGPGRKHMQWLWEQGQLLPRGRGQDNGPPPCLGHAILTSLCKGESHTQVNGHL